jgi:Cu2+-exporting ATPase
LGLATPTSITVAVGKGAKQGILIRDAEVFERMRQVDTLFVDKTGTLTEGQLRVSHLAYRDEEAKKFNSAIYAAERQSEHPIAKAVAEYFKENDAVQVVDFKSIAGEGVTFQIESKFAYLGKIKADYLRDEWLRTQMEEFKSNTVVVLVVGNQPQIVIGLEDSIKQEAQQAIRNLKQTHINVVMLTGDRQEVADRVASKLSLESAIANLKPEQKADIVKDFQEKGHVVAMAGDGVNDAPALAQADVSIAMSTGTDIAMNTAGVTLLQGDISKISKAIGLSKATSATIKQNLFWAFIYNIMAIPIAAGVLYPLNGFLLNPMIAGGAMAFSSVTVVLNSLRLKQKRV